VPLCWIENLMATVGSSTVLRHIREMTLAHVTASLTDGELLHRPRGMSTKVVALAEEVAKAMLATKSRATAGLLVVLVMLTASASLYTQQALAGKQPDAGQDPALKATAGPDPAPAAAEAKRPRRDRNGEPLPQGAVARMGTSHLRHGGDIGQFAFSHDSKVLAAASNDDAVHLWDLDTGKELRRLELATAGGDPGVAFSPDGKIMATAHYAKVRRWDTASWQELTSFPLKLPGSKLTFSPDGATLACLGREQQESQNTVVFLNAATGRELHRLLGLKHYKAPEVAFAPDSRSWAYVNRKDKFVWVYDSRTGKELRRLEGHAEPARTVAFSPDGQTLASTDNSGTLRFWETATGKLLPKTGHFYVRENLCYSPDGKVLAGGDGSQRPQLYDLAAAKTLPPFEARSGSEHAFLFSPNGKFLASAYGHCLHVWSRDTGKAIHHAAGHEQEVRAVAFAAEGQTVFSVAGEWGTVARWEARTGKELRAFGGLRDGVYAVACSPDGRTLAVGTGNHDGTVWLLDSASGKHLGKLVIPKGYVTSVAISADGQTLASKYQGETRLWNLATRQLVRALPGGRLELTAAALSPDGRTIAGGDHEQGMIRIRDVATGNDLLKLDGHRPGVHAVAFGPDGKTLASGGLDRTVRLWDLATGKQLWQAEADQSWVRFVAFSGDGKTVASGGGDKSVRLWETATGKERARFDGHRHSVECGAFAPDHRLLATGSADTTVLVWDLSRQHVVGPSGRLASDELNALWADLASDNARAAYQAIWGLAGDPERSVPFLKQRVRPIPLADAKRSAALIADLDSEQFAIRNRAAKQLAALEESAEPFLRQALKASSSAEAGRRLERLLATLQEMTPDRLRVLRALEALERMTSQEARQVLEGLAKGVQEARQTREAKAAVERLVKHAAGAP
jgi:WD40 repeat protein